MRFIHIADVHIGARPEAGKAYSGNREREILDTFKHVLEQCEKEKIDILLIAGGLFHRQPLLRDLKEVNYLFSRLTVTKVVFVVGNGDYLRENTYYRSFQWSKNVYPILSEDMTCVQLPSIQLAVYGCSYQKPQVEEKKWMQSIPLVNQTYHILLGHGGDDKHMPFEVNELARMPYHYMALGYQHTPEILVENRIAYAGSLEPIRLEDKGKHGYIQGELITTLDGNVESKITFVEFASREYKECVVRVDETMTNDSIKDKLLEVRQKLGMQHMYIIDLQGKHKIDVMIKADELDDIGNVIEIINHTYPNYDLERLQQSNEDNLLGAYIKSFGLVEEGSVEHVALVEGVRAIEETKKG